MKNLFLSAAAVLLAMGMAADAQFSNNVPGVITNTPTFNTNPPAAVPQPVVIYSGTNNPNGLYFAGTGSLYNQFDVTGTNFVAQWMKVSPYGATNWVQSQGGSILYVDASNTNGAAGARGISGRPFAAISNAVSAARAGDLVWVRPGIYAEHNLLKVGVNYHGDPGATIFYKQTTTNDDLRGIFDDWAGASTNYIDWQGALKYDGLTNLVVVSNYWAAFPGNSGSVYPNGGSKQIGVILITNPLTQINGFINQIACGNVMSGKTPTAIAIYNNNGSVLDVGTITNDLGMSIIYPNYDGLADDWTFGPSGICGLYWAYGNTYIHIANNDGDANSVWCDEPVAGTVESDLYYRGELIAGKIYTSTKDKFSVGWFDVLRIDNSCVTGNGGFSPAIDIEGGGKWYIRAQKIDATFSNVGAACIVMIQSGVSNCVVWLNANKLSASAGVVWIKQAAGTLYANVDQFEDGGGMGGNGIAPMDFSWNSEAHISGIAAACGVANMVNKNCSGPVEIKNLTMIDTNGVVLNLLTNGVTLNGVNMTTPSTAPVIANATPNTFAINWNGGSSTNGGVRQWTNTVTVFGFLETNNVFYSR